MSWERVGDGDGDGLWLARLSCPSLVSTLERTGKSRTKAIERAARSLTLLMALRGKINRRTVRAGRDEESTDVPWS